MLSDELTVWGYIKIPYPFLDECLLKISNLKGKNLYKDFPDFIGTPIICIGNALLLFGFTFQYEFEFEKVVIERFDLFLDNIKFLSASIQIEIENKEYYFYEYVSDGQSIHKNTNTVIAN